jgi:hypothetical protein
VLGHSHAFQLTIHESLLRLMEAGVCGIDYKHKTEACDRLEGSLSEGGLSLRRVALDCARAGKMILDGKPSLRCWRFSGVLGVSSLLAAIL